MTNTIQTIYTGCVSVSVRFSLYSRAEVESLLVTIEVVYERVAILVVLGVTLNNQKPSAIILVAASPIVNATIQTKTTFEVHRGTGPVVSYRSSSLLCRCLRRAWTNPVPSLSPSRSIPFLTVAMKWTKRATSSGG